MFWLRSLTNVKKQSYPDIERISSPLLRNNQFSQKIVGPRVRNIYTVDNHLMYAIADWLEDAKPAFTR